MPDIFIGVDEPVPTDYTPAPATLNDADWYIDGHRYRETGRTPTEGGYVMTLERYSDETES
jgi:hypothetical protein